MNREAIGVALKEKMEQYKKDPSLLSDDERIILDKHVHYMGLVGTTDSDIKQLREQLMATQARIAELETKKQTNLGKASGMLELIFDKIGRDMQVDTPPKPELSVVDSDLKKKAAKTARQPRN